MEYLTAEKEDALEVLELNKQLNENNGNFTINEINIVWINIEKNNIRYLITNKNKKTSGSFYKIIITPNLTYNIKLMDI